MRFDRETQVELRAYWQILRESDGRGRKASKLKPSDLRMMGGRPATVGDLAHVWLLSHPQKEDAKGRSSVRSAWQKKGASDSALDFWLQ
ncbi:hypothetical protein CMI37_06340 [Candidatus Pacearchaeota archaeon]|nr:hypothetical protein [Candidatus Pacearchaeota archaeon]|tara:strand:+ start:233 stop:499 length:267 start_codon:yes stop_codon:yes gene_type:complete